MEYEVNKDVMLQSMAQKVAVLTVESAEKDAYINDLQKEIERLQEESIQSEVKKMDEE